jgi:uncharacterized protein (DUF58 family)
MKWYVGIALLLMAALLLESGLLAYAMYVMVGLLLVTRLMARSWIGNLSATRACNRLTAEIGEKVAVEVTVHNSGKMPVPWVLLEDLLPGSALNQRAPRLRLKGKRLQLSMIGPDGQAVVRYQLVCRMRGYYQLGPLVLESGDLFGLHRRYRVGTRPSYLMVYPKVIAVQGYDIASRRPIGDVRLTHRLYEDPTRIAGIRGYEAGDPLNRVHWGATARTGALQSKIYEPSTLSGATIVLDFHEAGYHRQGEPFRSELAVTTAASLVNAVLELGQQVGLVSNGRDAADRLRLEGSAHEFQTRQDARTTAGMKDENEHLAPMIVPTRRGVEQLQHIRESLARVELTDGLTFAQLVHAVVGRLPRDATIVTVLPDVPVETALALGTLRRRGFAVTAVLIAFEANQFQRSYGRLLAEWIHDVRHLRSEAGLTTLCSRQWLGASSFYVDETDDPATAEESPAWTQQTPFDLGDAED